MNTRVLSAVFRKELVDNVRDRRAVGVALFMTPSMGPLVLALVLSLITQAEEKARAPIVPVAGRENAPALVDWLESHGVQVEDAPTDPDEAVREQRVDMVLVIDPEFDAALRRGEPARVDLVCDPTRSASAATLSGVERLLNTYGEQIGQLRLIARGVDARIVNAVSVSRKEVTTPQARGAFLFGMLPLMLVLCAFIGGLYVAIDVTAGERERGSLEALLYLPAAPFPVVLAKTAATAVFALLCVVVGLLAFAFAVPLLPFDDLGFPIALEGRTLVRLFALLVPTAILASAVQIVVGMLCKSFKTAQAALTVVSIFPALPGMVISMFPQPPSVMTSLVPTLGEAILTQRLLRGEPIDPLHLAALAATEIAAALLLVVVGARLWNEKLL